MKYKRVYLGVGSTLIGLFVILLAVGLEITSPDGDFVCTGDYRTESQCLAEGLEFGRECGPCVSHVNIYNPTPKNIFVYNKEEVRIEFSPNLPDFAFYVKDGRCSGKTTGSSCSCYLQDGSEYAIKGWRCVDFTNRTKARDDRLYVFKWPAYQMKNHLLIGFKESPSDNVKWGIGTAGEFLDPVWQGAGYELRDCEYNITSFINETVISSNVTNEVNQTGYNYTNYTFFNSTSGQNETATNTTPYYYLENITNVVNTPLNISYNVTDCIQQGNVYVDGINYSQPGYYCTAPSVTTINCDSLNDGNGDGICQAEGGETCITYNFVGADSFVRKSNSELYQIPTSNETTETFTR